jgi:hypothetical protein
MFFKVILATLYFIIALYFVITLFRFTTTSMPSEELPAASMFPLSPKQLADRAEWCLRRDDPHALDEVISLYYDALGYYNAMHACQGQLLHNLSVMLHIRFERRGNAEYLDEAMPNTWMRQCRILG